MTLTINYAGTANDPDSPYYTGLKPRVGRLNQATGVWDILPGTDDPTTRTYTVALAGFSRYAMNDGMQPNGGITREAIKRAKLTSWKGHCSVHQMFQPVHVDNFRKQYPDGKVIVHPECHEDVVNKADLIGSTEFIIKTVTAAPAGTTWVVGTELNLVNRLKHELTDKKVFFLSSTVCQCATMFRIDAPHLCWAMENLADGHVVNHIVVPD